MNPVTFDDLVLKAKEYKVTDESIKELNSRLILAEEQFEAEAKAKEVDNEFLNRTYNL
jgi:hypothetical protein